MRYLGGAPLELPLLAVPGIILLGGAPLELPLPVDPVEKKANLYRAGLTIHPCRCGMTYTEKGC
jgi:hypothetical protein